MKKIIILLLMSFTIISASFMSGVEGVIKSTLSGKSKKDRFPKVKTVGTVSGGGRVSHKSLVDSVVRKIRTTIGVEETTVLQDSSLFIDVVNKVEESMGFGKYNNNSIFSNVLTTVGVVKKPKKKHSILHNVFSKVKTTMGLKKKKRKKDYSLMGMMGTVTDTMGLTEEEKDTSFLGDIKSSTSGDFSGLQNTGKSAEFMSGVMYKSTKMYNNMFGMFSDSPLNIFEKKKEKSIFDVFDTGNDMLDLWD